MSEVGDLLELMQAMPVWNTVQATVVHHVDASQAAALGARPSPARWGVRPGRAEAHQMLGPPSVPEGHPTA